MAPPRSAKSSPKGAPPAKRGKVVPGSSLNTSAASNAATAALSVFCAPVQPPAAETWAAGAPGESLHVCSRPGNEKASQPPSNRRESGAEKKALKKTAGQSAAGAASGKQALDPAPSLSVASVAEAGHQSGVQPRSVQAGTSIGRHQADGSAANKQAETVPKPAKTPESLLNDFRTATGHGIHRTFNTAMLDNVPFTTCVISVEALTIGSAFDFPQQEFISSGSGKKVSCLDYALSSTLLASSYDASNPCCSSL